MSLIGIPSPSIVKYWPGCVIYYLYIYSYLPSNCLTILLNPNNAYISYIFYFPKTNINLSPQHMSLSSKSLMRGLYNINNDIPRSALLYLITHIYKFDTLSIKGTCFYRYFKFLATVYDSVATTSWTFPPYYFTLATASWACLCHHIVVSASNMYLFCCPALPIALWASYYVILVLCPRP